MKKNKILVTLFFVVVFGFPVTWYLFLQTFGENRFDLPVIGEWNSSCYQTMEQVYINVSDSGKYTNELVRVRNKMAEVSDIKYLEVVSDSCDLEKEIYLIDNQGRVRGYYDLSRTDIDRFAAELDIYLLNKSLENE
ncbi:MAG: hypothetical protein JXR10_09165 [Cyclobacteriaceae bacterium]